MVSNLWTDLAVEGVCLNISGIKYVSENSYFDEFEI